MTTVNGPGGVSGAAVPRAGGPDLSHLSKTNPNLVALMAKYPGLAAFMDKNAAAIAPAKAGTATPVTWNAWFHSPASLHQTYNWKDQFIFVFQRSADDKATVNFGSQGNYQGRLIGVQRMGDLDVPVKNKGGFEGGSASDGGFEAQFDVEAIGRPGADVEVCFCVGSLDAKGDPVGGWGTLGGYGGRQHDMKIGQRDEVPIHEDDGSFSVLQKKPGGGGYTSQAI